MIYITWQNNKSDLSQWENPDRVLFDRCSGAVSIINDDEPNTIATIENDINLDFSNLWFIRKLNDAEIQALLTN